MTAEALVSLVARCRGRAECDDDAGRIDLDVVVEHERHVAAGAAVEVKARPPAAGLPWRQREPLVPPAAQGAEGEGVSVIR